MTSFTNKYLLLLRLQLRVCNRSVSDLLFSACLPRSGCPAHFLTVTFPHRYEVNSWPRCEGKLCTRPTFSFHLPLSLISFHFPGLRLIFWGRKRGGVESLVSAMAFSRLPAAMWLWRAASWPLLPLSVLLGLKREGKEAGRQQIGCAWPTMLIFNLAFKASGWAFLLEIAWCVQWHQNE